MEGDVTGPDGQVLLPLARSASEWADAQRAFAGSVGDDEFRQEIWLRWWSRPPSEELVWGLPWYLWILPLKYAWYASQFVMATIRRLRGGPAGAYVMVSRLGDRGPSGPELLLCEVRVTDLPSPEGSGRALLVGELARNGTLAIDVDGRRLFPIYNPRAPAAEHLRASRQVDR